jgi:transcriptional regulator with XRE-family HTH domain
MSMMMTTNSTTTIPVGDLLRRWRQRRGLSQMALANESEVSPRHLSFLETGRARPSREMILRLADRLNIPLREQNTLLAAGGFAPVYAERPLDDPALVEAKKAVDLVLAGHEPYPALAIDRHWTLVAANGAVQLLMAGVAPELLAPPINVFRLTLHPAGLASRIVNFPQLRGHLLSRLRSQVEVSADPVLAALLMELSALPVTASVEADHAPRPSEPPVVIPFRLRTADGVLSFFSTTTVFGTPVDITLAELAIESFYPADEWTAAKLRGHAGI